MQFCSLEQKAAIQVENILICGHTFANYHRSVSFINNKNMMFRVNIRIKEG